MIHPVQVPRWNAPINLLKLCPQSQIMPPRPIKRQFSTLVIKRLYLQSYFENWWLPLIKSIFSMVLLLRTNSATGFVENFLASCSLQKLQVKSSMTTRELKWLTLWQDTAKYLQKYQNTLVCSPHVSIEPTIERSLIIELEEKPYCSSVSMVWWNGYRDYRALRKKSPYLELFWSALFPHFPAFGLNTETYSISLHIQSKCRKMQ